MDAPRLNTAVLKAFGPILILAGLLGFIVPPERALMSGAPSYNVFHVVFGLIGLAVALAAAPRASAGFNLVFGLLDLYQAAASRLGLFPAAYFLWKPADDVLHLLLGLFLALLGARGLPGPRPAGNPPS